VQENAIDIHKGDIIAARLLVMCLFMPPQLQVLVAIGASIYFVARTLAAKLRPTRNDLLSALLLGSGYLLYVGALPFTPEANLNSARMLCEQKSAYLLLPFVFAIMGQPFRSLIKSQLIYFVYGCIITCLLANADYLYHHFVVGGPTGELSHVAYRNIFENFSGIHPTYMAMYLCLGLYVALFQHEATSRKQVLLKYVVVYVQLLFMLALFAKSPIIALVLVTAHFLLTNRNMIKKLKWAFVSLVGIVTAAYFFIPFFRQRAQELTGLFKGGKNDDLIQNSVNMRKLIFQTDRAMLDHYWLTGTGPGRLLDKLNYRYFFHSLYREYWVGYFDPHNQYFYDWISFGVSGIIMLVLVLVVHFRKAIVSADKIYLYLLITIAITFFTESLLARQQGVLFYSIFTSLFFFAAMGRPKKEA
jgi:hypothetical protein